MILERASSVTSAYDDFINSAHEYGSSNMWRFANENVDLGKDARLELKRKLYRAIVNVNILEGIRFYVSFACSFAFGELKLMEGSAKIISLIARDESQHLNLTQKILTKWAQGDDPEMIQIIKDEVGYVDKIFELGVQEEKAWAKYLFKDGSMIGLNDRLLWMYIEWIANLRRRSINLPPMFDIPAKSNPLPWTEHWLKSKQVQEAPQETEKISYLVGALKQDMKETQFINFKL
jgi:ribonucleoside-diphosphate reductase beta chain